MNQAWQRFSVLLVMLAASHAALRAASTNRDSERRVLAYVNAHLQPGRPERPDWRLNKIAAAIIGCDQGFHLARQFCIAIA